MPFHTCPCCKATPPDHALIHVTDPATKDLIRLKVPYAARHDGIGWGDGERAKWRDDSGQDRIGLVRSKGKQGIHAIDGAGMVHELPEGRYSLVGKRSDPLPLPIVSPPPADASKRLQKGKDGLYRLVKAAPLKPGQRWITVHPNGPDEKGVPVLVQPDEDGSFRVIAGAGGKLTHLKHLKLKDPAQYAEESKAKKQAAAQAERERKAKLTPDQKVMEKLAKNRTEQDKILAERKFISDVRSKIGGVDEDLKDESLAGLADKVRNKLVTDHHRGQLAQAKLQSEKALSSLAEDKLQGHIANQALKASIEEHPDIANEVKSFVEQDLALKENEAREKKVNRTEKKLEKPKIDPEKKKASEDQQVEQAADPAVIEKAAAKLEKLGGESKPEGGAILSEAKKVLTPSEEVERRSAQAQVEAGKLAQVAKAEDPKAAITEETKPLVIEALKKQGIDNLEDADSDELRAAIKKEAVRKVERAQTQEIRAEKLKKVEEEKGADVAARMLAFTDASTGLASSVDEAKKLGLAQTSKAPLKEPEIQALMDVVKSKISLQKAQANIRSTKKEIDLGNYDASRRAVDLQVEAPPEKVALSVEEEIQRALTERLLGMGSKKRAEHLVAVAGGQYEGLADMGLGIAGQRMIDRPTLDAIGLGNAAVLMRHALESDGHNAGDVLKALESHHVDAVTRLSAEAIQKADSIIPKLSETVQDTGEIEHALARLDAHHSDVIDAQKVVGSALGKLEASATLSQAFRRKMPEHLTLATRPGSSDTATQAYLEGLGLKAGEDYRKEHGQFLIPRQHWDKLLSRVPKEEVEKEKEAVRIKNGERDEKGWLPKGVISRAASTFTDPEGGKPRYFEPLRMSGDGWEQKLEDHVGSRLADGETAGDIAHDLLSPVNIDKAPDRDQYLAKVRQLFPIQDAEGKARKFEDQREHFQKIASDYMIRKYGSENGAFHAQDLNVNDPATHEAVFRSLAEVPHAATAFKGTGDLSYEDQRVLRDHFYKMTGQSKEYQDDRVKYEEALRALGPEPDPNRGSLSMFGGGGPSGEWRTWKYEQRKVFREYPRYSLDDAIKDGDHETVKDIKAASAGAKSPWEEFVGIHGSLELAQKAIQDEIKGEFLGKFAGHYAKVTKNPLRVGVAPITNQDRHLKATANEEEREKIRTKQAASMAKLRERIGGQFASEGEGAVKQKFTRALEEEAIESQNQLGMFGARPMSLFGAPPEANEPPPELPTAKKGERVSIGERAENQIASVMPRVSGQFQPGKPVNLFPGLNMDGPRVDQQRVIKLVGHRKRVGAYLGTGSGKSLVSIGSFTDAHGRGEAQHGLFLVPPAVAEQFGGEMLRYTQPGKYGWATSTGKSHEERVKMLQDPALHMRVMTHQSFRDTAIKLVADHQGVSVEQAKQNLSEAKAGERAAMLRRAFDANNIPQHFVYVDEAHMATNRGGSDPSGVHMIVQAASHPKNASHALFGTATPHKNDESEVYSMAAMIDPDKYADKHTFMQNWGKDLSLNAGSVRREFAGSTYSARIDPEGVDRLDTDNPRIQAGKPGFFGAPGEPSRKVAGDGPLKLEPEHQKLVDQVGEYYRRAKEAKEGGQIDLEAIKALSPKAFEDKPPHEHPQIAKQLGESLGIIKEAALRRAVNQAPPEVNTKLKALTEVVKHDINAGTWQDRTGKTYNGKPSIIFTDSKVEADMIHNHLKAQGIRSGLYHGGLNPKEKEAIRLGFQPEGATPEEQNQRAKYDVVVATSAAEAGINMQRGKVIHHYDVPLTEKSHAQRSGRAYRQGQQGDVEIHNWHTDTDYEKNGLRRLKRKSGLAEVFQSPLHHLDENGIAGHYQRVLAEQYQDRRVA